MGFFNSLPVPESSKVIPAHPCSLKTTLGQLWQNFEMTLKQLFDNIPTSFTQHWDYSVTIGRAYLCPVGSIRLISLGHSLSLLSRTVIDLNNHRYQQLSTDLVASFAKLPHISVTIYGSYFVVIPPRPYLISVRGTVEQMNGQPLPWSAIIRLTTQTRLRTHAERKAWRRFYRMYVRIHGF